MTKKLYKSADGIRAPKGWLFQDNSKDMIALIRVSKVGLWTIENWSGNSILKDAYCSAEKYQDYLHGDKVGRPKWEITAYDPNSGHGTGIRQYSKKTAIREMKRLARLHDKWEKGWRP